MTPLESTPAITGRTVRSLMRKHRKTIRGIATEFGLTMKRVREVRTRGVAAGLIAGEWTFILTGVWPDHVA
ncbi:hypothetical protein [Nevskia sp.]|uniref:hypothetical protein n=1 Tax=Nevskia sp. TaxID=1929292 RepID=UPI0025F66ED2|nr:hypothetical protein [Nevskia sp.]